MVFSAYACYLLLLVCLSAFQIDQLFAALLLNQSRFPLLIPRIERLCHEQRITAGAAA